MGKDMHAQHAAIQNRLDDEYARVCDAQKDWAYRIAANLEAGQAISREDMKVAAGCLRLWADSLDGIRKRTRGKPAEFDHAGLAWDYVKARHRKGMSKAGAIEAMAEKYGCSCEMAKRIVKAQASEIETFLGWEKKG